MIYDVFLCLSQERKVNKFKEVVKPKKVRLEVSVDVDDATTMEVDSQHAAPSSSKKPKKRAPTTEMVDLTQRTLRESTKTKSASADVVRQEKEKQEKMRSKVYSRPEKPTFIQKELLKEALSTEVCFETNFLYVGDVVLMTWWCVVGRELSLGAEQEVLDDFERRRGEENQYE